MAEVSLSLILPAYNEVLRLPPYLLSARRYLDSDFSDTYEVLVVDDGSRDGLADHLRHIRPPWPQLRVLRHEANRGKGAAVRTGMLAACGHLRLFADADGATPIAEERQLRQAVAAGADLAVGSRLLASPDVTRRRTWRRALIGRSFAGLANWYLDLPVRDSQCGFKMLHSNACRQLFGRMKEDGYLFDLELLLLAEALGYKVAEVPIEWSDVAGSRLEMRREIWRILAGLRRLRREKAGVVAEYRLRNT